MNIRHYISAFALTCILPIFADAQLVNTPFGQNRLQFEKYKWYRYESNSFAVSFPEELEELAKYVVETAEADYYELKNLLEYNVRNKIEVILYGDYSDYEQNNIGQYNQTTNNGGTTKLFSHKILLYFDGNHTNLHRQLRAGIARALVNRMVFGGNFQEVVQNAILLQLPIWFTEGAIEYAANDWSTEHDDQLREAFLLGNYTSFMELAKYKPKLAGQSMFHFISQNYKASSVTNLIYLSRVNRSIESGFLYVFGTTFYSVTSSWYNYYKERYNQDNVDRKIPSKGEIPVKIPMAAEIQQAKISPNGKYVAYTEHIKGRQFIHLYDISANQTTTIWKSGLRDLAPNLYNHFPRIAWTRNSRQLIIAHDKRNKIYLHQYNLESKKISNSKIIRELESIVDIDAYNGQDIVLSGIQQGHSDIYICNMQSGKLQPLTQDEFDDVQPAAVQLNGVDGIVFASSRVSNNLKRNPKDTVYHQPHWDLFFYNLSSKSSELIRITETPHINEYAPVAINKQSFAFLSDANGIRNRYIGTLDTVIDHYKQVYVWKDGTKTIMHSDSALRNADLANLDTSYLEPIRILVGSARSNTDYSRGIVEHHIATEADKVLDLLYYGGEYKIFVRDFNNDRSTNPSNTQFREILNKQWGINKADDTGWNNFKTPEEELRLVENEMNEIKPDSTPKPKNTIPDTNKIDIDNYSFQSEFKDIKQPNIIKSDTSQPINTTNPEDTTNSDTPIVLTEGNDGTINQTKPKTRPHSALTKPVFKPYLYSEGQKSRYRNLFRADAFTIQFDNTPLFNGMDLYLGNYYRFNPFSIAMKSNFSDIFENYRLELCIRIPILFNGFEAYAVLEDRKSMIDKRFVFYRRGRTDNVELIDTTSTFKAEAKARNIKHLAQAEFKYPIDKFQSVRASVGLQADRISIIAQEIVSLSIPVFNENRFWIRAEYVFDNTVDMRLNLRKGWKVKAYMDFYKPFDIKFKDKFQVDMSGGLTTNIGFDARKYISLDGKTVFATRLAGASSFGKEKILYSLGGLENSLVTSTNTSIPLPQHDVFAYQTLASPMRGFQSNIRNGSSFMVFNAELRVPIMEYMSQLNTRSTLLRSLQFVPFFDIGTAWHGLSPFSKDNPLNTTLIDRSGGGVISPVRVHVNYYRKPIVMSFGAGIRTVVSGYYFRADLGWGVETGAVQTPRLQVAIGTDF